MASTASSLSLIGSLALSRTIILCWKPYQRLEYHGKYSFDTFTHRKSCLVKDYNPVLEALSASRYPPYSENKMKFIMMLMRKRPLIPGVRYLPYLGLFGLGVLSSVLFQYLATDKESVVQ
ncbi:hypothetical protein M8J77_016979 [Diaphorina citri]|nr:hypothetical protein M8J77_016979 [Diaphorina citri]